MNVIFRGREGELPSCSTIFRWLLGLDHFEARSWELHFEIAYVGGEDSAIGAIIHSFPGHTVAGNWSRELEARLAIQY